MVFNQVKYNELREFAERYIKSKEYDKNKHQEVILKKANELGLSEEDLKNVPQKKNVNPKIVKRIVSDPNISDYDKKIYKRDLEGIKPRGCYSHQYPYIPPVGTEGYERFKDWSDCGDHCVCVDKGVDKESIDRMNLNKLIEIDWTCDGEHNERDPENIEQGQSKSLLRPSTTIRYKGIDRKKLGSVIKSVCRTSKVKEHETGLDVCKNKIPKNANIFSISGKERSSRDWWQNTANKLNKLLEIEDIPRSRTKSRKSTDFDFGSGFQF